MLGASRMTKDAAMQIEPFRIHIPDAAIADLKDRLARTRWPDQPTDAGWELGTDLTYLKELAEYWRTRFDWRSQERALNAFSQFRAKLGGETIHFIHVRGKGPKPLPLVVTHGWPGSFAEMVKLIPLLADPASHGGDAADAFDVVVPSMPGYGFSSKPKRRGMSPFQIAALWTELMQGLGYARFGAQGGDWGSAVSVCLGFKHPEQLLGIHLNFISSSFAPPLHEGERPLAPDEQAFLDARSRWFDAEAGYNRIQATKPQTLGYGLNDSPAGLAAWIAEKFRSWTDCGGEIERSVSKDELLTDISIYWFTETIASSFRIYNEVRTQPLRFQSGERVIVPAALAIFPKEIPMPPRKYVERVFDVVQWTEMPRGGHFAALEEPQLLAEDVRRFFRRFR